MEDFIKNFEEAIDGCEPGSINSSTSFRELPFWDSLSLLSLLAMIDINYNKQITVDELNAMKTVQDLFDKIN